MVDSKLLLWVTVVFCHLATYTASFELGCNFTKDCQPVGSSWWKCRAYVKQCSAGKKYHCAKDYDSPEDFKDGCAMEEFCRKGEEPFLSFLKNSRPISEPEVFCQTCTDKNRYNSKQNTSSAEFSECPYKKWNICTEDEHKKLCKPEDSTEERYCRCDARKGFYPVNNISNQTCSYEIYICGNRPKKCGAEEELLLNYTCAPKCDEGFARLNDDNDDCERLPSVKTTRNVPIPSTSARTGNSTTIIPSTKAPETSRQLPLECDEECEEYQICDSGECVCPEVCAGVYEPVCGYHEESDNHETFSSRCQLDKQYCKQRKFVYYANGECKTDKTTWWIILIVIISALVCVVALAYVIYKSACKKKKYSSTSSNRRIIEIEVETEHSSPESVHLTEVDGSQENGRQPNGSQQNRKQYKTQLSAPLSEHEETSTPHLSSNARKTVIVKTTNIYKGPFIQSKGADTVISVGSSPKSGNKKVIMTINKEDIVEGEDEPLLDSKDESRNTIPVIVVHRVDEQDHTLSTAQPSDADNNIPNSSATADNTSERNNTDVNIEADIGVEKNDICTQKLGSFYKRQRRISVSHESLFLEPDIQDIREKLSSDDYKTLINKVMDRCLSYLLENMDPISLLDRFTTKEMFAILIIRDISDLRIQTVQSREIVKRIRETGVKNYEQFKVCLWETKQEDCLTEVKKVQSEVLKEIKSSVKDVSQQSQLTDSLIDDQNITSEADTNVLSSLEAAPEAISSTSLNQEKECLGTDNQSCNSQESAKKTGEDEFHDHPEEQQAFRQGPSVVPPEKILEERIRDCLKELENISEGKSDSLNELYQKFEEKCEEIRKQMPELTSATLDNPEHNQHCLKNQVDNLKNQVDYKNTPDGFQAYSSSGKDKSCFYQSISFLLNRTEDLQYFLRLLTTLHAVKFYKIYKEQLMMQEVEKLKPFFFSHTNESTWKKICNASDAEYIIDICLQTLIMETSCLGTDSSVLHVDFLCGALGMNIRQHFQQKYVEEKETIPWEKIIQGDWVNPDKSDLHIFWVNHRKEEKGDMDHIVPLLRKESTTVTEHAS